MGTPLLSISDLRVQFDDFLAVDDVSFELHDGELLGLVGPNGAGKTTTLCAAAGLQPVTTGRVEILGHDVFANPTIVGRHLSFTPDTPALYETLTVEQFLEFIARCYGLSRQDTSERIDHWLQQLWLTEKKTAKVGSLSRGMRQRLAVARSLIPDPHVVLMDEPAAGLDPAGRVQFRQMLADLRDQGKAIIVSSHILADLAEYCTHVAFMEDGKFRRHGTVAQISGAEQHERTRYRVGLASRVGDLTGRLAGIKLLRESDISGADGLVFVVEHESTPAGAAALLAELISAGLPVAEFQALTPDLEEVYLRMGIRQVD